jgi:hypothetical protein
MTEPGRATRNLRLSALVDDTFDGAVRLIGDAQRFGFSIRELHLDAPEGASARICLTLCIPGDLDPAVVRSRLARHPTVVSLDIAREV